MEPSFGDHQTEHLRVLIANELKDRLALVAPIVVALGHEVIAREIDVRDVGPMTARERPDVALVRLGASSEHALELIDKIVREAACPVIAPLHAPDPGFVNEASNRGVFAHINNDGVEDWQSSIDIVLRRFAEYHDLEGAFGRRALTERAKGILMERHSIQEKDAFEMLRDRSRIDNRKLIDLATAVVDGHRLLPKRPHAATVPRSEPARAAADAACARAATLLRVARPDRWRCRLLCRAASTLGRPLPYRLQLSAAIGGTTNGRVANSPVGVERCRSSVSAP